MLTMRMKLVGMRERNDSTKAALEAMRARMAVGVERRLRICTCTTQTGSKIQLDEIIESDNSECLAKSP